MLRRYSFYTWKFVPFHQPLPISSTAPLNPSNIYTPYFYEFDFLRFCIKVILYSICLSLFHLFHVAQCIKGPLMLSQMERVRPFSWLGSIHIYTWAPYIYHIFFIHSSTDGHLGCLHILGIVKNAVMNMGEHISFQYPVFISFRIVPICGIAGSYGSSIFNFLRRFLYRFPQWLQQFTFPPTV